MSDSGGADWVREMNRREATRGVLRRLKAVIEGPGAKILIDGPSESVHCAVLPWELVDEIHDALRRAVESEQVEHVMPVIRYGLALADGCEVRRLFWEQFPGSDDGVWVGLVMDPNCLSYERRGGTSWMTESDGPVLGFDGVTYRWPDPPSTGVGS